LLGLAVFEIDAEEARRVPSAEIAGALDEQGFPVGIPLDHPGALGMERHLCRDAVADGHGEDLILSGAIAGEGDSRAIRRKDRSALGGGVGGELPRQAAAGPGQPKIAGPGEGDLFSIGRKRRR